jgi:hypothetical protein
MLRCQSIVSVYVCAVIGFPGEIPGITGGVGFLLSLYSQLQIHQFKLVVFCAQAWILFSMSVVLFLSGHAQILWPFILCACFLDPLVK